MKSGRHLPGCDGFIVKPISTRAFLEQVARFLGMRGETG